MAKIHEVGKKDIFINKDLSPAELYGLVSQMRRAVIAIPSNISEGYGRKSSKSYRQFILIAYSSALELETQLLIAKELEFVTG